MVAHAFAIVAVKIVQRATRFSRVNHVVVSPFPRSVYEQHDNKFVINHPLAAPPGPLFDTIIPGVSAASAGTSHWHAVSVDTHGRCAYLRLCQVRNTENTMLGVEQTPPEACARGRVPGALQWRCYFQLVLFRCHRRIWGCVGLLPRDKSQF